MVKTTIREYYLLTGLKSASMGIISATYVLFLIDNGLNLFEVNLVNFAFFTTLFLCEIPTGAFADVFGRKASFIVAMTLLALGMLIYAFSDSFMGFVIAEMVSAVGGTFASGAFRAWFVDKLRHHGYTGELGPVFAKANQVRQVSCIVAALTGAFLAGVHPSLPWFIGACLFTLTGVIACFLAEEYFVPRKFSFKDGFAAMKDTVRSSMRYGSKNANVRFVLVVSAVQFFAVQAPNMQWQPYFGAETDRKFLGFMWTAMALSFMAGAWLAPKLLARIIDERKALAFCQIATGVGIMATVAVGFVPAAIAVFLLHEVARGMIEPLKDAYLHDNIPSKERATIDSFDSLSHHAGGSLGLIVSGFIAVTAGIPIAWGISGLVLVVSTLVVMRNGRKRELQTQRA